MDLVKTFARSGEVGVFRFSLHFSQNKRYNQMTATPQTPHQPKQPSPILGFLSFPSQRPNVQSALVAHVQRDPAKHLLTPPPGRWENWRLTSLVENQKAIKENSTRKLPWFYLDKSWGIADIVVFHGFSFILQRFCFYDSLVDGLHMFRFFFCWVCQHL